jgi:hypothetical protein
LISQTESPAATSIVPPSTPVSLNPVAAASPSPEVMMLNGSHVRTQLIVLSQQPPAHPSSALRDPVIGATDQARPRRA